MRHAIIGLALLMTAACSGSGLDPSAIGNATDISGNWTGAFASTNNPTADIGVSITQNGTSITGTWTGVSVSWNGALTGTMNGSSFSGQLTFSGTTLSNNVCTGSANVSGSASSNGLTMSSTAGVVGAACAAPLPVNLQIDLHR